MLTARLVFLCALLFATVCSATEVPSPVAPSKAPPGLEGLVWHKWDTENFTVISLDKSQGYALKREVEETRADISRRWNISFKDGGRCKVVCVTTPEMLKKLFGLDYPRCEPRSGEPSALWIDSERISLLGSLIAEVELSHGGHRSFVRHGIPLVERRSKSAREDLSTASASGAESLSATPPSVSDDYRRASAFMCLMVRMELGSAAFGRASVQSDRPLHEVLGYSSAKELSSTFSRYCSNLAEDVRSGRAPNKYIFLEDR